jgi:hypothetical protein
MGMIVIAFSKAAKIGKEKERNVKHKSGQCYHWFMLSNFLRVPYTAQLNKKIIDLKFNKD